MSLEFSFLSLPPLLGTDSRPSVGVQKDLSGCHGDGDLIIHLQDSSGKGRQRPWLLGESQVSKVRDKKESRVLDMGKEVCQLALGRRGNIFTSFQALRGDRNADWNLHPVSVHSKPTARSSSDPC